MACRVVLVSEFYSKIWECCSDICRRYSPGCGKQSCSSTITMHLPAPRWVFCSFWPKPVLQTVYSLDSDSFLLLRMKKSSKGNVLQMWKNWNKIQYIVFRIDEYKQCFEYLDECIASIEDYFNFNSGFFWVPLAVMMPIKNLHFFSL